MKRKRYCDDGDCKDLVVEGHHYCARHQRTPPGADVDPSWGPIGSLMQERDPEQYAKLKRLDDAYRAERKSA